MANFPYSHGPPAAYSSYYASLTAAPFETTPAVTSTLSATSTTSSSSTLSSASPTTLQTSFSSSISSTSKTATTYSANNTADAVLVQPPDASANGVPSGTIAAVVIAIVLVLLVLAAVFFCLYRRRSRLNTIEISAQPPAAPSAMQESNSEATPFMPFVMTTRNPTYYTGLDTAMSEVGTEYRRPVRSEAGSFLDPPPPYKPKRTPSVSTTGNLLVVQPPVRLPTGLPDVLPSWQFDHEQPHLTPADSISRSASRARHSIDSDAYSETASLHSAHAARMPSPRLTMIKTRSREDPFGDPDSPASRSSVAESQSWRVRSHSSSPVSRVSRS